MLHHIKNLTKHSAIYSISTFIQRTQGLIMLPIYTDTSYLATKSVYGDYILVYTFIAFMNIFYLYGLDSSFLRYYFLGQYTRKDIYRSAIQIVLISSLLTSAIIFLFASSIARIIFNSSGYDFFIKIAAGILLFDTLCNLPYLILRAEEKSFIYTLIRIGRFILELALNIIFVVYLKYGVKGILFANLLAAAINLLFMIPFQWSYIKGKFSFIAIKDLLTFGLPLIPNSLAYLLVEISDKYLMSRLLDKDTLGEYGVNYRLGTLMLLIVSAFRTAWQPFFLKIAKDPDAKKIYARILTYFICGATFVVISGSFFVEYIVQIPVAPGKTLLGKAYWGGVKIIPIILLSYLCYGVYVNLTVGIYIKKKSQWMFLFTGLAALFNISSNFYLMPHYGMMGAAFATLLAYLIMMLSIFIANQKFYPIKYEYKRIFWIGLYLICSLVIFYAWNLHLVVRIIILLTFPVMIFALNLLNDQEKSYLKRLITRYLSG